MRRQVMWMASSHVGLPSQAPSPRGKSRRGCNTACTLEPLVLDFPNGANKSSAPPVWSGRLTRWGQLCGGGSPRTAVVQAAGRQSLAVLARMLVSGDCEIISTGLVAHMVSELSWRVWCGGTPATNSCPAPVLYRSGSLIENHEIVPKSEDYVWMTLWTFG